MSRSSKPAAELRAYEAEAPRRQTVYQLAAGLVAVALVSVLPALADVREHLQALESPGLAPWASLLLMAGVLQLAYAMYLVQIPDWSTVWVASLVYLILATAYAMFLGVFLLADAHSQFIGWMGLVDHVSSDRAVGWCVTMLCLSCLLAYALGRYSVRWHRAA